MTKENELIKDLYKKLFLIRAAEEKIREHYKGNEMKTPVHLAEGEEAIASGVCQALSSKDKIFATYRNHGIYLARTGETDEFFGELFGRVTGMFKGKGGSMHISSPRDGFLGTSAVVATTIPVAVGCAYTLKIAGTGGFAVAFFGDGAIDEGVFWESVNFASLKKLPVIFICEDNDLAIHSKAKERHGYRSITGVISKFDCNVLESKTTDALKIMRLVQKAKALYQRNGKPVFVHLHYYRYLEHVGINTDFHFGYRSEREFKRQERFDPVSLMRKKLIRTGVSDKKIVTIEKKILARLEISISAAGNAPSPKRDELLKNVFV